MASDATGKTNSMPFAAPSVADALRPKTESRAAASPQGKSGSSFASELAKVSGMTTTPPPAPVSREKAPAPKVAPKTAAKPAASAGGADVAAKADRQAPANDGAKAGPAKAPVKADKGDAAAKAADAKGGDETQSADGTKKTDEAKAEKVAKKDLSPLKQAAASNRDVIAAAPAVAFLSGHLDQLQPAQIPTLVTDNIFLTSAMSVDDLQSFLNDPTSIADLLQSLDLPDQIAQDVEQLGLDPATLVTPADFLKSIGLDPQRVFAELKVLKDNLSAGGLAGYMKRADALTGRDALRDLPATAERPDLGAGLPRGLPATTMAPTPVRPLAGAVTPANAGERRMAQGTDPAALIAGLSAGQVAQPGQASIDLKADSGRLSAQELLALQVLGGLSQATPALAMPMAGADDLGDLQPAALDDVIAPIGKLEGFDAAALAEDAPAQTAIGKGQAGAAPSMHRGTFDAWAAMGDRLRGTDTQTVRGDAAVAAAPAGQSLGESLMSRQLADAFGGAARPAGLESNALAALATKDGRTFDPALLAQATARPEVQPELRLDARGVIDGQAGAYAAPSTTQLLQALGSGMMKDGPSTLGRGAANTVSVEDLRLAAPIALERGFPTDSGRGAEQGFGEGGSAGQGGREFFGDVGAGPLGAHHAGTTGTSSRSEASFGSALANVPGSQDAQALTPEQRAHMVQQVIDRSTMLVREGGGTVRLDLGSPELGNLEMAINMNDDRIDLRVMTASDRVREAMMGDIARLREALAVQNVQLGNVDVGVGGRNPNPSAFAGFGGFQQSRQGRESAFSGDQGQGQGRRERASLEDRIGRIGALNQPLPHLAAGNPVNQHGRLAVRA